MHRVRINILSSLETRPRRCWIKVCADKRSALLPKSMFVCVEMGEGGGVEGGGGEGRCEIWVSTDGARCLPLVSWSTFCRLSGVGKVSFCLI